MARSCRDALPGLRGRCIRGTWETPKGRGLPGDETLEGSFLGAPILYLGMHLGNAHPSEEGSGRDSRASTSRFWRCSRRKQSRRSPTPASTVTSSAPGPTGRR